MLELRPHSMDNSTAQPGHGNSDNYGRQNVFHAGCIPRQRKYDDFPKARFQLIWPHFFRRGAPPTCDSGRFTNRWYRVCSCQHNLK
jgi:hypothetical protein